MAIYKIQYKFRSQLWQIWVISPRAFWRTRSIMDFCCSSDLHSWVMIRYSSKQCSLSFWQQLSSSRRTAKKVPTRARSPTWPKKRDRTSSKIYQIMSRKCRSRFTICRKKRMVIKIRMQPKIKKQLLSSKKNWRRRRNLRMVRMIIRYNPIYTDPP